MPSDKRKLKTGVVLSDKLAKTRSVEVTRLFRHPLYEKVLRRRARYLVHDEANASKRGDQVVIRETRPLSRRKRWEILKIINRKPQAVS